MGLVMPCGICMVSFEKRDSFMEGDNWMLFGEILRAFNWCDSACTFVAANC